MNTHLLEVDDLTVEIKGVRVVDKVNLHVDPNERILLIGPNGSGKTSLLNSIAGDPRYKVLNGRILLNGVDITNRSINERVMMGIGIAVQNPPKLKGVTLYDLAENILKLRGIRDVDRIYRYASELSLIEYLDRDVNVGFSGGEIKRTELFLTIIQEPKIALLDEVDSGVDIGNIKVMARVLDKVFKRGSNRSLIIVTHTGYIADYMEIDRAYIMINKRIIASGDPHEILSKIREYGYSEFIKS